MLKRVTLVFVASRALVICAALFGAALIGLRSPGEGELLWDVKVPFFNLFARWDSCYYLNIAREGYVGESHWAFRPLFPLVLRALGAPLSARIGLDASATVSGFLANNLFFMAALILIYELTCNFYPADAAIRTVLSVAFFPSAVFYSSIYAESLYLLLLVACFYTLEKGSFYASGGLGFLAGLTRPEGFLASLVIIFKGLRAQGLHAKLKGLASAAAAALSLPAFLAYAHLEAGGFHTVYLDEMQWGGKFTVLEVVNELLYLHVPGILGCLLIVFPVVVIGLAAVFSFFARKGLGSGLGSPLFPYYLFSAILMVIYLTYGDARSLLRHFSTVIPMHWTLSLWMARGYVKLLVMAFFVSLMTIGTVLFVNWYHFL